MSEESKSSAPPSLLGAAPELLRRMGVRWAIFRGVYAAQKKLGILRRRTPMRSWGEQPLAQWLRTGVPADPAQYANWRREHGGKFFFDRASYPAGTSFASAVREAEEVLSGVWPYFGGMRVQVGFPPKWNVDPRTGQTVPDDRHWTEIPEAAAGDIKFVWEASRFSVVYLLARAYATSQNDRYADAFWTLVEDWAAHNPPNRGPNWMCGQEASFRVMALCFGLHTFSASPATLPERVARLSQIVVAHAGRIEANISYARSQRNNHAISEAMGLFTIGTLFPEFALSERWRDTGARILEEEVARQILPDGSYVQYSANYHRLVLHDLVWTMRLGEVNDRRFSPQIYDRVASAVEFLHALTDPETGAVPNFGSNDGALVLPLNSCGFDDFRPVLQLASFLTQRSHRFEPGPWDEDLWWLFGAEALKAPVTPVPRTESLAARSGGYYTLSGADSWAMLRCSDYAQRPSQSDELHLDLWWKGQNIACDAGTYLYSDAGQWNNALAWAEAHNTVTVDGSDPMRRLGRFLWLDWPKGERTWQARRGQSIAALEAEHTGYATRGVAHKRAVVRAGDTWIVIDDVLGGDNHRARLHWLLQDFPIDTQPDGFVLRTPAGPVRTSTWCSQAAQFNVVRAGATVAGTPRSLSPTRGWRSQHYGEKQPALSVELTAEGKLPLRFVTVFQLGDTAGVIITATQVSCASTHVMLRQPGDAQIVQEVAVGGEKLRAETPLHLVLIHQAFAGPNDAGGTRHYEFARRLSDLGHKATIIASPVSYLTGKLAERTGDAGSDPLVIRRAYAGSAHHASYASRVLNFVIFMITSFLEALKVRRPDVVMGTSPPIFQAFSALLVARIRGCPFLLEIRDLWPEFAVDMGVLRHPVLIAVARGMERFLYRNADHLLVNSPAYRDYLIQHRVSAEKITVIANGVDPDMFDPESRADALRSRLVVNGNFVITYAGAMGAANDLDVLLRAAARVRTEPVMFLLIGDGKERANLEKLARDLHLDKVHFIAAQKKNAMRKYLAASDAGVAVLKNIPMFRTTYPNKVFDYMAAGRPVLLAIDGVIREVVEAADCGIFVPPGNDEKMAEAIVTLSRDRARAEGMGRSGRSYVAEHFNRNQHGEQFADLLVWLRKHKR
jgi:asparagine synthase (glutamine-hydrolysing)